jgi:hypothetical protein
MNRNTFVGVAETQILAAVETLEMCVRACPDALWKEPVGTKPFWHVVHHTLGFTDLYLAKRLLDWKPDRASGGMHPGGRKGLWEGPAREFGREELLEYARTVREKVELALCEETPRSLAGPSGFSWIKGARAETYLYNLRHLSHHVGQLTAFLWKHGCEVSWVTGSRSKKRAKREARRA